MFTIKYEQPTQKPLAIVFTVGGVHYKAKYFTTSKEIALYKSLDYNAPFVCKADSLAFANKQLLGTWRQIDEPTPEEIYKTVMREYQPHRQYIYK